MDFRTPLGKAKGLGVAKLGSAAWWAQRVTAVALVPLTAWFVWFLTQLPALSHTEMLAWLGRPQNTVLLLAYLGAAFYHAMLGLKVIIEDYVHPLWLKTVSLLALKLILVLLISIAAFAIVRIVP